MASPMLNLRKTNIIFYESKRTMRPFRKAREGSVFEIVFIYKTTVNKGETKAMFKC